MHMTWRVQLVVRQYVSNIGRKIKTWDYFLKILSKRSDTAYRLSESCIGTFKHCISPKHYQVDDKCIYLFTKSTMTQNQIPKSTVYS